MTKYWVFLDGKVPGCFGPEELAALPRFRRTTLVCAAEGEIRDTNWRHAGEIEELAQAIAEAEARQPPLPPAEMAPVDLDSLLDSTGRKLFSHVAELMRVAEDRREAQAMASSLQEQLAAAKADLIAEKQRAASAEFRLGRIAELEEARQRDLTAIENLQDALRARDETLSQALSENAELKERLQESHAKLGDSAHELLSRGRQIEKLSHELTEKDVSLAKALSLIKRLEDDLNRLLAGETAPPPPLPVDPAQAAAQQALADHLRRKDDPKA